MKLKSERETYPLFECPECVLSKCDPLHQVMRVLVPPYVVDNRKREFQIEESLSREIKQNGYLALEVRAIKLEDKSHEQCWPHNGELVLNQYKYLEFKPLQQNSSLKKRKDEKFVTSEVNPGVNSVWIKFVRGSDPRNPRADETYIAAVYLVRRLNCEELARKVKTENRRPIEECRKKISDDFDTSAVDIDKLVYPMTCVFDMQPLKTPAKGAHCKHPNCFSLENFVNVWQKNNQRKWNCPICKLKSYDIIIDTYFEKIMEDLKKSGIDNPSQVEVEIMKNAEYRFVKNEDDSGSEDEQRPETKTEKAQPEKSMNFIVLDDSDDEGNGKSAPQAATNTAKSTEGQTAMGIEDGNAVNDAKKKISDERMAEEKGATQIIDTPQNSQKSMGGFDDVESKRVDADKGNSLILELNQDAKKPSRQSPIQISSNDATPIKVREFNEAEQRVQKHAPLPTEKEQTKYLEQKHREALINKGHAKLPAQLQEQQHLQQQQAYQQALRQAQERAKFPYMPNQSHMDFSQLQNPQRQGSQDKPGQLPQQQKPQQQQQQQQQSKQPDNSNINMNANMQKAALAKLLGPQMLNPNQNMSPQVMNSLMAYIASMNAKPDLQGAPGRNQMKDVNPLMMPEFGFRPNFPPEINALLVPYMRQLNEMPYQNAMRMGQVGGMPQQQQQQQPTNPEMVLNFSNSLSRNQGNPHPSQNQNIPNQGTFLKDNLTPKHPGVRAEAEGAANVSASPKTPGTQRGPINDREKSTKEELMQESERQIEQLIDCAEVRLELPSFATSGTKKNFEARKIGETDFQKNRKLVSAIMKQLPLQTRKHSGKQSKGGDGPEININGDMDIENKQQGADMKVQGKASDPICLD